MEIFPFHNLYKFETESALHLRETGSILAVKFPVRKGWCILSDKRRQSTIAELLFLYGRGVLTAPNMQTERKYVQHRHVSCFEHSVAVAYMSIWIARRLRLRADLSSLVRGALLHDYFLYDWRCREASPRLHGLRHPRIALDNARRDFSHESK